MDTICTQKSGRTTNQPVMNKKFLLTLCLLFIGTMGFSQENTWDQKESFVIKRERSASFAIGGIGYVCAGLDSIVRNDLWQYDPAFDAWTQLADLPSTVRRNPVSFSINGKGYVGTGHSGQYSSTGVNLKDFWEYDPILNSWVQKADYPGGGGNGVYLATGFATTNYGYIACGKKAASTYASDLWRYDPVADSWLQRASFPGGERYNLMNFVINDTAYVGFGSDQDIFRKDLWAYDEISNSWQQRADCNGDARAAGGSFTLNGRGFICCGVDGGFEEDLWEYDSAKDQWKIRAYFPTDGRRYGISFALNNKGYFGAGKGSFGKKRSFYEYFPMSQFGWMMEELNVNELNSSLVTVAPNPIESSAIVSWDDAISISHGTLYNMAGSNVGDFKADGNQIKLDRSNHPSGMYLLTLFNQNNKALLTKKISLK